MIVNCLAQCFTKLSTSFIVTSHWMLYSRIQQRLINIRNWSSENQLFTVKSQEKRKPMVFGSRQITAKQFHSVFAEKGTNSCWDCQPGDLRVILRVNLTYNEHVISNASWGCTRQLLPSSLSNPTLLFVAKNKCRFFFVF